MSVCVCDRSCHAVVPLFIINLEIIARNGKYTLEALLILPHLLIAEVLSIGKTVNIVTCKCVRTKTWYSGVI